MHSGTLSPKKEKQTEQQLRAFKRFPVYLKEMPVKPVNTLQSWQDGQSLLRKPGKLSSTPKTSIKVEGEKSSTKLSSDLHTHGAACSPTL